MQLPLADESITNTLRFREAQTQFLVKVRVQFRHCLWLVSRPKIVQVLQATSATKPGLTETLERVKAHSVLFQFHLLKARSEPTVL